MVMPRTINSPKKSLCYPCIVLLRFDELNQDLNRGQEGLFWNRAIPRDSELIYSLRHNRRGGGIADCGGELLIRSTQA